VNWRLKRRITSYGAALLPWMVWSASERVFEKSVTDVGNFQDLAELFFERCKKDLFRLFAATARQIWFRRNRWIHEGVFTHPNEVARFAAVIVEDFSEAQLGVTNRVREKGVRSLLWKKPPVGWVKVNCDAPMNLTLFYVGLGVAIRDHDRCLIAAKSLSIEGAVDPGAAEAMAFIHGVSLCRSLGFQKLILEGDAKVVIYAYKSLTSLGDGIDGINNPRNVAEKGEQQTDPKLHLIDESPQPNHQINSLLLEFM
jgi:hypothetical protein